MPEFPIPPDVVESAARARHEAFRRKLRSSLTWDDIRIRRRGTLALEAMEAAIRAALGELGARVEWGIAGPKRRGEARNVPDSEVARRWSQDIAEASARLVRGRAVSRFVSDWRPVDGWTDEFGPSARSPVGGEPSESDADLEQAWRNGFGSALNCLRACDDIAQSAHGAKYPEGRILSDLVNGWVDAIEGLIDDIVAAGREVGFASRAHLTGPSATSEGER
jgi:hypothetical protein